MFRFALVAFIYLSTAHADWADLLEKRGFTGQVRPITAVAGNMKVIREVPYRHPPIPGWPGLDDRFSDELLHAHGMAHFYLALTPFALPEEALTLSVPGLPYPVLLVTPTAGAGPLAREARKLSDIESRLKATLQTQLEQMGFAAGRARWLSDFTMEARARAEEFERTDDRYLIAHFNEKWSQPVLDYLLTLPAVHKLGFETLFNTYFYDIPKNRFQTEVRARFRDCALALTSERYP